MSLTERRPRVTAVAAAPLPLVVAGLLAGAAAALLSFAVLAVITLTAWMLDPSAAWDWAQMLEVAAGAWLAGQGVSLLVLGVPLSLAPLGFGLLCIVAIVAGMRWSVGAAAVARPGEAAAVVVSAAIPYAGFGALLATLGRHLGVSPGIAAITVGVVAVAVGAVAMAAQVPLASGRPLPRLVKDSSAGALAGVLMLVAMSAIVLVVAIVGHTGDIGRLLGALEVGPAGAVLITALSLAYLPTAIVWSSAYLLGPGFAVSTQASLSAFDAANSSTLPGLPLLAALPADPPSWAVALPLLAVLAGAVIGVLLRRRGWSGLRGVGAAALAATMSALVVAAAAWLTSGGLGEAHLAELGAPVVPIALAALGTLALGSVAVVVWPHRSQDTHDG